MKKILTLLSVVFFTAVCVNAGSLILEVKGSYFYPTEGAFQDIYGGGFMYGGEVSLGIWKNLFAWIGGYYFSKYGELSYTGEETYLQIFPIGGGLKYRIKAGMFSFYGGAGANYFDYYESNVIGDETEGGVGFVAKLSACMEPVNHFVVGLFVEYSYCTMTPADFTIDIGGIKAGLGIGVRLF